MQTQPTLSTSTKLQGEYAVVMIDLDIPTNTPPKTNTLLHWLQTGLTSAETATTLNTTRGASRVFLLQNRGNAAALASYIGPNPPARVPLSHRYTEILVNHTGLSTQGVSALQLAAGTRQGFDAMQVLTAAGLADRVVAGNFFNVTNAGPVNNTGPGTGPGTGSGSGTGTAPLPTTSTFRGGAGALAPAGGMVIASLGVVAAVFFGL